MAFLSGTQLAVALQGAAITGTLQARVPRVPGNPSNFSKGFQEPILKSLKIYWFPNLFTKYEDENRFSQHFLTL